MFYLIQHIHNVIISTQNQYFKNTNIFYNLQNPVLILYLLHVSIGTSILQELNSHYLVSGYRIGQCSSKKKKSDKQATHRIILFWLWQRFNFLIGCHHLKSDFTLKYQFLASLERSCLVTLGSDAPTAASRSSWQAATALPFNRSIGFPVTRVPITPYCFSSLHFLPGHTPVGILKSTATTYGDNIKTTGLFNVANFEKEIYLCICTLFVFLPLAIYVTMNLEFK